MFSHVTMELSSLSGSKSEAHTSAAALQCVAVTTVRAVSLLQGHSAD